MKIFFILFSIVVSINAFAQKPLPELWGLHVHDDAHILKQETVDQLETQLKSYEDTTTNQIAILIITSLEGENLEEYSLRVAEKWKLGNKEKDNGVLLLIAFDDHKMRIETGQGLQGVLTDAMSSRIIRNDIATNFRKNEYDAGVTSAINSMIAAIGGEYKVEEAIASGDTADLSLQEKIFMSVFIFGILGVFTFIGFFVPGNVSWFLYAFLIPFYAIFPWMILGVTGGIAALLIYLIGFPILKKLLRKTNWGSKLATKMATNQTNSADYNTSGSTWSSGSDWSSSGDSSSSSSSDFSGGGGSFDGGGSSGSW